MSHRPFGWYCKATPCHRIVSVFFMRFKQILGAFGNLQKATISFVISVNLSVCLFVRPLVHPFVRPSVHIEQLSFQKTDFLEM